jgi:hypothetical protein
MEVHSDSRDILKDESGKEYYVYKVSGAGLKCGYRVLEVGPEEMGIALFAHRDEGVPFREEGVLKIMSVRDIIKNDMANFGLHMPPESMAHQLYLNGISENPQEIDISDSDIQHYLEDVYTTTKYNNSGEFGDLLIPAIFILKSSNINYFTYDPKKNVIKSKYQFDIGEGHSTVSFYNNGAHFDRLVPVIGATEEEIETAEKLEADYYIFKEYEQEMSASQFNQLFPVDLPPKPSEEEVKLRRSNKISTLKDLFSYGVSESDILKDMGYTDDEIEDAKKV